MVYPTTMGFPTKNDHFGGFWGYHHLRKHPNKGWINPTRSWGPHLGPASPAAGILKPSSIFLILGSWHDCLDIWENWTGQLIAPSCKCRRLLIVYVNVYIISSCSSTLKLWKIKIMTNNTYRITDRLERNMQCIHFFKNYMDVPCDANDFGEWRWLTSGTC